MEMEQSTSTSFTNFHQQLEVNRITRAGEGEREKGESASAVRIYQYSADRC